MEPDTEPEMVSDYEKKSKNRGSQLLLVLFLFVTVLGGYLTLGGSPIALGVFIAGLVGLIVTAVWCFKNWDY